MSNVDRALSCFKEGYSCAQAVFSAFAEHSGLDSETALRIAGGFGGGMGRMGGVCGAVTGAYMVIGLKHCKITTDQEAKAQNHELIREFADRFKSRNEFLSCRDLLGYDISIPEEMEIVREKQLFATHCTKFVQDAVEIIEEMPGK